MKFPYGVRDFDKLISEGYLYIDRTDRIPLMERLKLHSYTVVASGIDRLLWLTS